MSALAEIAAHASVPNVYFSYGMTKSGSTLGFELARTALDMAGLKQVLLPDTIRKTRKINFTQHLDDKAVLALEGLADAMGYPIAIKTHTRPDPGVVRLLETGRASAHAIYRDPRDIALSMLDHGARARAKGKPAFSEYHVIEDTIEPIKHQTNTLLAWLSLPNVRPLFYDDLAFDTQTTAALIADELGLDAQADVIQEVMTNRFTQLNVGIKDRHLLEMDGATSARFKRIFAPLYDHLIEARAALPRDGRPVLNAKQPLALWDE